MPAFTVPNSPDTIYGDLAEPDARDFEILGQQTLYGVLSGCQVVAQGSPDMTVAVASGVVLNNGTVVAVTSGNVAIVAAEANPRIDMIVVDASGVKSAVKGTASTNPRCATLSSSYTVIAYVYVFVGATSVANAQIVDKRIMLSATFRRNSASGTDVIVGVRVTGDTVERASLTADGSLHFGSGAIAQDVTLARTAVSELSTDSNWLAKNYKRGAGSPEGVVSGSLGDLYIRTDGGVGTTLYVKSTAAGNTGWYQQGGRKGISIPHTWTIAGPVAVASGQTNYICPFYAQVPSGALGGQQAQQVFLSQATYRINFGTSANVTVNINGSAATGFSGISVTQTKSVINPTDIALTDQDELALVVNSVSGSPYNLSFTVNLFYLI